MTCLPEEATLQQRLCQGEVTAPQVVNLGQKVARFHAEAEGSEHISSFGRLELVAQNVRENLEQTEPLVGVTISRAVFDRLRELFDNALTALGPLIEKRAQAHVPRDTHGDLHLDHVYFFPDRQAPADLVIIDCIEFNDRFRFADPMSDMAFLYMDFLFHGRSDLAEQFAQSYFQASGDADGRTLLPFYAAYRAAVRGEVVGVDLAEEGGPATGRAKGLGGARGRWR